MTFTYKKIKDKKRKMRLDLAFESEYFRIFLTEKIIFTNHSEKLTKYLPSYTNK